MHAAFLPGRPGGGMSRFINEDSTFNDVYKALTNYENIDDFLGSIDIIITDRVFIKIAELLNIEYEEINELWLKWLDAKLKI